MGAFYQKKRQAHKTNLHLALLIGIFNRLEDGKGIVLSGPQASSVTSVPILDDQRSFQYCRYTGHESQRIRVTIQLLGEVDASEGKDQSIHVPHF